MNVRKWGPWVAMILGLAASFLCLLSVERRNAREQFHTGFTEGINAGSAEMRHQIFKTADCHIEEDNTTIVCGFFFEITPSEYVREMRSADDEQ